jgi:hypothetical protein
MKKAEDSISNDYAETLIPISVIEYLETFSNAHVANFL